MAHDFRGSISRRVWVSWRLGVYLCKKLWNNDPDVFLQSIIVMSFLFFFPLWIGLLWVFGIFFVARCIFSIHCFNQWFVVASPPLVYTCFSCLPMVNMPMQSKNNISCSLFSTIKESQIWEVFGWFSCRIPRHQTTATIPNFKVRFQGFCFFRHVEIGIQKYSKQIKPWAKISADLRRIFCTMK